MNRIAQTPGPRPDSRNAQAVETPPGARLLEGRLTASTLPVCGLAGPDRLVEIAARAARGGPTRAARRD